MFDQHLFPLQMHPMTNGPMSNYEIMASNPMFNQSNNTANVPSTINDQGMSNVTKYNKIVMSKAKNKGHQKAKFSPEEDQMLINLVKQFGEQNWNIISIYMEGRNIRQCRERWRHYLSPSVSNAPWTLMEDYLLDQKYAEIGPKWKQIAEFFPNRTDINIKNRYLLKQRHFERLSTQIAEISAEYNAKMSESKKFSAISPEQPNFLFPNQSADIQQTQTSPEDQTLIKKLLHEPTFDYSISKFQENTPKTNGLSQQTTEAIKVKEIEEHSSEDLPISNDEPFDFIIDAVETNICDFEEDIFFLHFAD